eukprot:2868832-Amphidinium_carterae.2
MQQSTSRRSMMTSRVSRRLTVHVGLDRELPGPACPLLMMRRHVMLPGKKKVAEPDDFERRGFDVRIIITRTLRSVSDQVSARGSCATSCFDVWGARAGCTSLRDPRDASVYPGRAWMPTSKWEGTST